MLPVSSATSGSAAASTPERLDGSLASSSAQAATPTASISTPEPSMEIVESFIDIVGHTDKSKIERLTEAGRVKEARTRHALLELEARALGDDALTHRLAAIGRQLSENQPKEEKLTP